MTVTAGTYNYYIAPFQYRIETLEDGNVSEGWAAPDGAVATVNLRAVGNHTASEHGGLADWGFFAVSTAFSAPSFSLALGNWLDGTVTNTLKSDIIARLPWLSPGDLSTSVTVLDTIWDMLTIASDPTGSIGPRPLLPGISGTLGLHLGGHSEVRTQEFRWGVHPATQKIAESLQHNYSVWYDSFNGVSQHHRKALGGLEQKYAPMGLTDYRDLLPQRFKQSPDHRPMKPETTFTDDFNRANTSTLGSPWVTIINTWAITGSQAGGAANGTRYAEWAQDLSSDDHYSLNVMGDVATFDDYGIVARVSNSGSGSMYFYDRRQQSGASHRILYVLDGTQTVLGTLGGEFGTNTGDLLRIECEGSTIRAIENGTTKVEVTDTTLSGQLRAGMMSSDFIGIVSRDSWTAADLGGAPATIYYEAHATERGINRGIARSIA